MARILDRLLDKRVIVNCEREPYLHRWFVLRSGERLGVYVHRFVRSDEERAVHDHPWNFVVIPIWRGYWEVSEVPMGSGGAVSKRLTRVWPILGTRVRSAEYRHRVVLMDGQPAWSIFIRFQRRRVWGFWMPTGWKAWNQWWREACE